MTPSILGRQEDHCRCFRTGGGLTFDEFGTEHMLHSHRLAVSSLAGQANAVLEGVSFSGCCKRIGSRCAASGSPAARMDCVCWDESAAMHAYRQESIHLLHADELDHAQQQSSRCMLWQV